MQQPNGHDVLIAGAGPTGLMLAGELALAGVSTVILEQRPSQALAGSRAGGLHARTIEILDQRGIAGRFLAEGQIARAVGYGAARLEIGDLPSRHACTLGLWQNHIERLLAAWVTELGVPIHYGRAVTGFSEDEAGVTVQIEGGEPLRAHYLVACDGGKSQVRKAAGIAFPGEAPTTSSLIAELEMEGSPPLGIRRDALGLHGLGRVDYHIAEDGEIVFAQTGPMRVMLTEARVGPAREPTLSDLKKALIAVYGMDFGAHAPTFISRFTDAARQAAAYKKGRLLLAGDAAHIHSPDGGMGLNTGVQDAVNLGWKLGQVIRGAAPESLLDTYEQERRPVAARAIELTMAASALRRPDARSGALRGLTSELLAFDEPRKHLAGFISGLSIHYDLGAGHPLLGRRMPDLDLTVQGAAVRLYALLHQARPLLLNFAAPGSLDITAWKDRVQQVDATYEGPWDLPVLGPVSPPAAVLVRPDGYVAWVGEGSSAGLSASLAAWFGPEKA